MGRGRGQYEYGSGPRSIDLDKTLDFENRLPGIEEKLGKKRIEIPIYNKPENNHKMPYVADTPPALTPPPGHMKGQAIAKGNGLEDTRGEVVERITKSALANGHAQWLTNSL